MYRKEGVYILKIKNYILFAQHVYVPDTQQFYKVTKKLQVTQVTRVTNSTHARYNKLNALMPVSSVMTCTRHTVICHVFYTYSKVKSNKI